MSLYWAKCESFERFMMIHIYHIPVYSILKQFCLQSSVDDIRPNFWWRDHKFPETQEIYLVQVPVDCNCVTASCYVIFVMFNLLCILPWQLLYTAIYNLEVTWHYISEEAAALPKVCQYFCDDFFLKTSEGLMLCLLLNFMDCASVNELYCTILKYH